MTLGCGANPPTYCPADPTARRQMALFTARAVLGGEPPGSYADADTGRSYSCEQGNPSVQFTDAHEMTIFCAGVHYAWARGFMDGCGPTDFCGVDPTLRNVGAGAVAGAFDLGLTDGP